MSTFHFLKLSPNDSERISERPESPQNDVWVDGYVGVVEGRIRHVENEMVRFFFFGLLVRTDTAHIKWRIFDGMVKAGCNEKITRSLYPATSRSLYHKSNVALGIPDYAVGIWGKLA